MMKRPHPPELHEILSLLQGSRLLSLEFWSMGWVAVLESKQKTFQLVSDRGYIDAYELVEGRQIAIPPPEDQRISIKPGQVCELLLQMGA